MRDKSVMVLWVLSVLCLVAVLPARANTCQGQTATLTVTGSENITVSSTAIGFTAAKITNASLATFYVYTAPIAYTLAGDTPSTSVGYPAPVGAMQGVCGLAMIKAFRAIRTTGADAVLYVTYWKSP